MLRPFLRADDDAARWLTLRLRRTLPAPLPPGPYRDALYLVFVRGGALEGVQVCAFPERVDDADVVMRIAQGLVHVAGLAPQRPADRRAGALEHGQDVLRRHDVTRSAIRCSRSAASARCSSTASSRPARPRSTGWRTRCAERAPIDGHHPGGARADARPRCAPRSSRRRSASRAPRSARVRHPRAGRQAGAAMEWSVPESLR